jgi:hypothetical protein
VFGANTPVCDGKNKFSNYFKYLKSNRNWHKYCGQEDVEEIAMPNKSDCQSETVPITQRDAGPAHAADARQRERATPRGSLGIERAITTWMEGRTDRPCAAVALLDESPMDDVTNFGQWLDGSSDGPAQRVGRRAYDPAVGQLIWRIHRALTAIKVLVHQTIERTGASCVITQHLLEYTVCARELAMELRDAIADGQKWEPLGFRLVDAITAVVGLTSYACARARPIGLDVERVWRWVADTLDATRDIARRAQHANLDAEILQLVESELYA